MRKHCVTNFYLEFERHFYMNTIVTIIPTDLDTNLLLSFFCPLLQAKRRVALYFKAILNSVDFYKVIFLWVIPVCIIVQCSKHGQLWQYSQPLLPYCSGSEYWCIAGSSLWCKCLQSGWQTTQLPFSHTLNLLSLFPYPTNTRTHIPLIANGLTWLSF